VRTGDKPKVGSHLDDEAHVTQCGRCDKGLHRACEGLKHCTARKRSPPGVVKRNQGEQLTRRSRRCSSSMCEYLTDLA
jgi:hypothetical protein